MVLAFLSCCGVSNMHPMSLSQSYQGNEGQDSAPEGGTKQGKRTFVIRAGRDPCISEEFRS